MFVNVSSAFTEALTFTNNCGFSTEENPTSTFPNSALKKTFKLSPYFDINSFENVDCNRALFEIFPRIDMKKVDEIIDNTPYISDVRKNFYKIILSKRYEMVLKPAYELLIKKNSLCYPSDTSNIIISKNPRIVNKAMRSFFLFV